MPVMLGEVAVLCLALPGRVIEVNEDGMAIVDFVGVTRQASVGLLDNVHPGDFLLVHAGCAIARIEEAEARDSLALWEELIRYATSS